MIYRLFSSTAKITRKKSTSVSGLERRGALNRRLSIIICVIVVIFLIPEVSYGIFELYTVLRRHSGMKKMDLHTNRAFHAVYEILLVLSYHANFWVYTILNERFRSELKKMFREFRDSFYRLIGKRSRAASVSSATQMTPVYTRPARRNPD